MRIAIEAAKFTAEEANGLRRLDGDLPQSRHHRQVRRQDGRQHDRARLRSGICQKLLRPDQGVRLLWLPGEPCRELRAARLCLVMAEALSSRRVLLRTAQLAADGLLRARRRSSATPARTASRCARSMCPLASRRTRWKRRVGEHCAVRLGFRQIDGFSWKDADEERLKRQQASFRGAPSTLSFRDVAVATQTRNAQIAHRCAIAHSRVRCFRVAPE